MLGNQLTHGKLNSSLAQSVKSSKARKASGKILLEGERLIADAMKAGVQAEALFFSNTELLASLPLQNQTDCKLYQVRHNIIQLWSDLSTSPGIMGIICWLHLWKIKQLLFIIKHL